MLNNGLQKQRLTEHAEVKPLLLKNSQPFLEFFTELNALA